MKDLSNRFLTVEHPRIRRDVMDSMAVLSDVEYQQRAWVRQEGFAPGQFDDFAYHIHVLYDDAEVLPDPQNSIGSVLVSGDEIDRIRAVGVVLDAVLEDLSQASAQAYLAHPRWPDVLSLSSKALAAMVRAWGFPLEQS